MATSPPVSENVSPSEAAKIKLPLVPLFAAMIFAVLLGVAAVAGAMYYLVRSGRFPVAKTAAVEGKIATQPETVASHVMILEPMVANLADAGGGAYLKVSLTLRIANAVLKKDAPAKEEKPAKGMSDAEAGVRDTVLMVVGRQTSEVMLAPTGKEQLKADLRAAFAEHNADLKVMDIYFIDFLVQR